MPAQGPLGIANERAVEAAIAGGPKPADLVLSRVSTTRQGCIDTKRKPALDCDRVMPLLVPLMAGEKESLAIIVNSPCVPNVAENVPTPLVRFPSAGNTAVGSVLANCTGSL